MSETDRNIYASLTEFFLLKLDEEVRALIRNEVFGADYWMTKAEIICMINRIARRHELAISKSGFKSEHWLEARQEAIHLLVCQCIPEWPPSRNFDRPYCTASALLPLIKKAIDKSTEKA